MKKLLLISMSLILFYGCGGSRAISGVSLTAEASTDIIEMEPDWWSSPEPKEGYVIGKAEGVSRSKEGSRKICPSREPTRLVDR